MYKKIVILLFSFCTALTGGRRGHGAHNGNRHINHARTRHATRHYHAATGLYHHTGNHGGYHRGWHRGWGWGSWGWPGFGWGWNWKQGILNGFAYDYMIPPQAIQIAYNNHYPYWGYGIKVDKNLDTLAREHKWQEVKDELVRVRNNVGAQIEQEAHNTTKNRSMMHQLEDQLNKIQLHLNGLIQEKT